MHPLGLVPKGVAHCNGDLDVPCQLRLMVVSKTYEKVVDAIRESRCKL